jgi:CTP:molybdopterin cytidylyltransferase MocA
MGRPKALLDFGGRTALDLVLDACAGLGDPVVVLGAHPDLRVPRGRIVVNSDWARGQTSSLKAGLRGSTGDFLLFPIDYALVTADDVRAVASARGRIVIPSRDMRRGHPVRGCASASP